MRSFAYMRDEVAPDMYYMIWSEIEKLKWYFVKFAGNNADEAMQKTLMHAITHFSAEAGSLPAYVKKLAREITKDNGKLIFVDFLEQTLSDEDDELRQTSRVNTGKTEDFSNTVVDEMMIEEDEGKDIVQLALLFMDKFLILCEALINRDTSTTYYPDTFIKECLRISSKNPNFNSVCIDKYMQHSGGIKDFLDVGEDNIGVWRETDYSLLQQNVSRRVRLCNKRTGMWVEDADLEDFRLDGNLESKTGVKRVVKVRYEKLWERLCDLVDSSDSNVLKYIIDDQFIIRTLGGSLSVVNPNLYNIYDLIRDEILTNVLIDTNGRVLNVGSECFYLLCSEGYGEISKRVINGIEIELDTEDITDSIS